VVLGPVWTFESAIILPPQILAKISMLMSKKTNDYRGTYTSNGDKHFLQKTRHGF
jgi:hypothetical protein